MKTPVEKATPKRPLYMLTLSEGETFLLARSSRRTPPRTPGWLREAPAWVWVKTVRQRKWRLTKLKSARRAMDAVLGAKTAQEAVDLLVKMDPTDERYL